MSEEKSQCTCIWTGDDTYRVVWISMGEKCPAWPHPRTKTITNTDTNTKENHA